ncbi:MAG: C1 family peptidase [Candidatus Kapaibacteriales bacterium]
MIKYLPLFLFISLTVYGKDDDSDDMLRKIDSVYQFEEIVNLENTDIKNQNRTGTCWSFAGNSFLESELLRMGKGEHNLSEMYIVRNIYPEKAMNYVRYHGKAQFGQGSLAHDVLNSIDKYGAVPEEVYSARPENDYLNHAEMFSILNSIVVNITNTDPKNRTSHWMDAFEGVIDAYMGDAPEEFEYRGKKYTPKSFANFLSLSKNDYVDITSFTHHKFGDEIVLEVPDNWSRGKFLNVPMDKMLSLTVTALENGYTVNWGADVSEPGFESDYGLAINPADIKLMEIDKEMIKWDSLYAEATVTQEMRQEDFDNYLTQDDHGMHIIGIAKDKLDRKYFIVKNSWGYKNPGRDGYLYVSFPYFQHKTTSIQMHKDVLQLK